MSDLKSMIKIEVSETSLTAWVWLPPQQAAECLASVATAWINRGRDLNAPQAATTAVATCSPRASEEYSTAGMSPIPDSKTPGTNTQSLISEIKSLRELMVRLNATPLFTEDSPSPLATGKSVSIDLPDAPSCASSFLTSPSKDVSSLDSASLATPAAPPSLSNGFLE